MKSKKETGYYTITTVIFAGLFALKLFDIVNYPQFYVVSFNKAWVCAVLTLGISFFGFVFFCVKALRSTKGNKKDRQ